MSRRDRAPETLLPLDLDDDDDDLLPEPDVATVWGSVWPPAYDDAGLLGAGAMGEVRLVRDRHLHRDVALKVLKPEWASRPAFARALVAEARAVGRLQHPGIVPVHAVGMTEDGRPWFVMPRIAGHTLRQAIRARTTAPAPEQDARLHALIQVFARVCEAVAYAHEHGVVHRDLKPDNVMLGDAGEVFVLDFGIASTDRAADPSAAFSRGTGTPAFMAPEVVAHPRDRPTPRVDVYALGCVLYNILAGRPPFDAADPATVLSAVRAGPPVALTDLARAVPPGLVAITERAMARDPDARHPDASALLADVRAWLDGSQRRAAALVLVAEAVDLVERSAALRERAAAERTRAAALLAAVRPWEPETAKAAGWAAEDQANALAHEAVTADLESERRLEQALTRAPDAPEVRAALVERLLGEHRSAEAVPDHARADTLAFRLRTHAALLPAGHPTRVACDTWLRGDGAVTLHTHPAGATVTIRRFEPHLRRLVLGPPRPLGTTPLVDVPLPMGSYVLEITHPGHHPVRYPVHITRAHHWHGRRPGDDAPTPVWLPPEGALGPGEVYIPAGWFVAGGPPGAQALPRRRLWADALVVQRFAVTNRDWIRFLDDLVDQGREADALRWAPRERASGGAQGALVYGRDDRRFVLQPDADGDLWDPDWPVVLIDWASATAYAAWLADRSGLPWRLPAELEWEKAAAGVDGRQFPWGDTFDASWACTHDSHRDGPSPSVVDAFPVDTSVYGVRGMAGNTMEWCADAHGDALPADGIVRSVTVPDPTPATPRVYRGGAWGFRGSNCRVYQRYWYPGTVRFGNLGLRLVRSVG